MDPTRDPLVTAPEVSKIVFKSPRVFVRGAGGTFGIFLKFLKLNTELSQLFATLFHQRSKKSYLKPSRVFVRGARGTFRIDLREKGRIQTFPGFFAR